MDDSDSEVISIGDKYEDKDILNIDNNLLSDTGRSDCTYQSSPSSMLTKRPEVTTAVVTSTSITATSETTDSITASPPTSATTGSIYAPLISNAVVTTTSKSVAPRPKCHGYFVVADEKHTLLPATPVTSAGIVITYKDYQSIRRLLKKDTMRESELRSFTETLTADDILGIRHNNYITTNIKQKMELYHSSHENMDIPTTTNVGVSSAIVKPRGLLDLAMSGSFPVKSADTVITANDLMMIRHAMKLENIPDPDIRRIMKSISLKPYILVSMKNWMLDKLSQQRNSTSETHPTTEACKPTAAASSLPITSPILVPAAPPGVSVVSNTQPSLPVISLPHPIPTPVFCASLPVPPHAINPVISGSPHIPGPINTVPATVPLSMFVVPPPNISSALIPTPTPQLSVPQLPFPLLSAVETASVHGVCIPPHAHQLQMATTILAPTAVSPHSPLTPLANTSNRLDLDNILAHTLRGVQAKAGSQNSNNGSQTPASNRAMFKQDVDKLVQNYPGTSAAARTVDWGSSLSALDVARRRYLEKRVPTKSTKDTSPLSAGPSSSSDEAEATDRAAGSNECEMAQDDSLSQLSSLLCHVSASYAAEKQRTSRRTKHRHSSSDSHPNKNDSRTKRTIVHSPNNSDSPDIISKYRTPAIGSPETEPKHSSSKRRHSPSDSPHSEGNRSGSGRKRSRYSCSRSPSPSSHSSKYGSKSMHGTRKNCDTEERYYADLDSSEIGGQLTGQSRYAGFDNCPSKSVRDDYAPHSLSSSSLSLLKNYGLSTTVKQEPVSVESQLQQSDGRVPKVTQPQAAPHLAIDTAPDSRSANESNVSKFMNEIMLTKGSDTADCLSSNDISHLLLSAKVKPASVDILLNEKLLDPSLIDSLSNEDFRELGIPIVDRKNIEVVVKVIKSKLNY